MAILQLQLLELPLTWCQSTPLPWGVAPPDTRRARGATAVSRYGKKRGNAKTEKRVHMNSENGLLNSVHVNIPIILHALSNPQATMVAAGITQTAAQTQCTMTTDANLASIHSEADVTCVQSEEPHVFG